MNLSNCCLLILSSVVVLLLIDRASAARNKCVFKCLKGVIKCNRGVKVSGLLPSNTDCCAQYSACYLNCDPLADSVPPCNNKGKRGSWNKRVVSPIYNSPPRSDFGASEDQYANDDPFSFLWED